MLIRKFLKDAVPTSMKRRVRDTLAMFRPWHHLEDLPPRSLKFETTNLCNANCVFCGYQYQDRSIGVMSMELFERALQDYVGMGGENISFTPVVGEPLVDHNIFERIRIAKGYPQIKNIYFYTSGILLARKNCVDELLTSGLSELRISTAGFDRTMFERVYRSKMYDRYFKV